MTACFNATEHLLVDGRESSTCDHGKSLLSECEECDDICPQCGDESCVCCSNCNLPTAFTDLVRPPAEMCSCPDLNEDEWGHAVDEQYDIYEERVFRGEEHE